MKRMIMFIFLFVGTVMMADAQSRDLNIWSIFETDQVVPSSRKIETRVKGRALSKYRLNYYRSVRIKPTADEAATIYALFRKDWGDNPNYKIYGSGSFENICLMLPRQGKDNRFVCLVRRGSKRHIQELTLIYMEGSISSINELKSLIGKSE
jgi:hypothetical protein